MSKEENRRENIVKQLLARHSLTTQEEEEVGSQTEVYPDRQSDRHSTAATSTPLDKALRRASIGHNPIDSRKTATPLSVLEENSLGKAERQNIFCF